MTRHSRWAGRAVPELEKAALCPVVTARRDLRRGVRDVPVPDAALARILATAHLAPGAGRSRPWDFLLVQDRWTRVAMHALAMRQREAFAASLHSARVKGFGDIEVEAILDAPLDVVVTSGPARGGRHMRGRRTEVQTAAFSTACAVENLWLAARAQSPGVGSVSFFDERERARTLALPSQEEIR